MKDILTRLVKNENGQDLVEYSLLVAFVVMAGGAMGIDYGISVQGILSTSTDNLSLASAGAR